MNNLKWALLMVLLLLAQLVSAQQHLFGFYERGSLQLPNAEIKRGLILMPVAIGDSLEFLYFRKDAHSYPAIYYADEILSVEIFKEAKRYLSVMLPGETGMERRIAELHFSGEFFLLSAKGGKGELFYIADNSGKIAKLENTYEPPSAENNFKPKYHYEFRSVLSSMFGDNNDIHNSIAVLKFTCEDLTTFLEKYHRERDLPYSKYPPPRIRGSVGASGGLSVITNVNPIDDSKKTNTLFASTGLFGQFNSYSELLFLKAGVSGYKGHLFYDQEDRSTPNYIVFTEENIEVSIISLNLNLGLNLFAFRNFSPFISSGLGYYGYTRFKNNKVLETLDISKDIVTVTLSDVDEKPAGFVGIVIETGANYNLRSGSRIQFGASYIHFPDSDGYMKNGTGISVSYHHKLF